MITSFLFIFINVYLFFEQILLITSLNFNASNQILLGSNNQIIISPFTCSEFQIFSNYKRIEISLTTENASSILIQFSACLSILFFLNLLIIFRIPIIKNFFEKAKELIVQVKAYKELSGEEKKARVVSYLEDYIIDNFETDNAINLSKSSLLLFSTKDL